MLVAEAGPGRGASRCDSSGGGIHAQGHDPRLNMHLRRMLAVQDSDLSVFFNASWLLNAYNEVTTGKRKVKVVESLRDTFEACMPPFSPSDRTGIQQCLLYDARNLATVAASGVWMHFHKRVLAHVRGAFALSDDQYAALSKDETPTQTRVDAGGS